MAEWKETIQTGDLLLFHSKCWYSWLIEWVSGSPYSHVGILLRDPININSSLKGLYLLESSALISTNAETGKGTYGVKISPLDEVLDYYRPLVSDPMVSGVNGSVSRQGRGTVTYRALETKRDANFYSILKTTHQRVHEKRYNLTPGDWLQAALHTDIGNPEHVNKFWCSALVAFCYVQWGLLPKTIPWSLWSPADFSETSVHSASLTNLGPEITLRLTAKSPSIT